MKLKEAIGTIQLSKKKKQNHYLYTKWGEALDSEHVLEEYPRPQLRRDNFTILNGYWDYAITKAGNRPVKYDGQILVPFSPESMLSGVNRQLMPEEYLWYERKILIHKKPENKKCILHFGAVDQWCEVYFNNEKILEHMGGYLPFDGDITEKMIEGENILTLKVTDNSDASYHSRGKQKLKRGGMFYTAQSGIWQTTWLEWVPYEFIKSMKITPLVDTGSVELNINMNTTFDKDKSKGELTIDILSKGKVLQSVRSTSFNVTISVPELEYWSPESPFLYDMVVTYGEDRIESYFAMRKYEVKKDQNGIARIFLNNQPYFQNGLLDQGYWSDGLYTAPSDEAMIYDIQKAKELGFNMLRKHIKIEPLRWYYHCDRLGIIVWQDMVNGGGKYNMVFLGYLPTLFPKLSSYIKDNRYQLFSRDNVMGRIEWTKECINTVEHLYNCPSIAVWVPFNEGWGQFDSRQAAKIIGNIDKGRLIDHASGWFDQKGGDFKSIHNYFRKLTVIPEKRAIVLSEFGGYACYIEKHSYSNQIYGYRKYVNVEDFNQAYEDLFHNEITKLIHKGLSACVYTQLADVEDEVNGLLTYDRKVCKISQKADLQFNRTNNQK